MKGHFFMLRHSGLKAIALVAAILGAPAAARATNIGVTMSVTDESVLLDLRAAIVSEAGLKGVGLQLEDADNDVARQLRQIGSFIAEKADAIIVEPVDPTQTTAITALAVSAKVPLVYVHRKPQDGSLPPGIAFVGADDRKAGQLQAEELVRCLGRAGNVVILQGPPTVEAARDRTAAVEEVLAASPGIKILEKQAANWNRDQAIDLVNDWIAKGEVINGVAANNDDMALGALFAIRQAGLDPRTLCIGGIGASAKALAEIADGTLRVSVWQSPDRQGKGSMDVALALIKARIPNPALLDAPVEQVTRANVGQYAP